jgi:hypothetical protein
MPDFRLERLRVERRALEEQAASTWRQFRCASEEARQFNADASKRLEEAIRELREVSARVDWLKSRVLVVSSEPAEFPQGVAVPTATGGLFLGGQARIQLDGALAAKCADRGSGEEHDQQGTEDDTDGVPLLPGTLSRDASEDGKNDIGRQSGPPTAPARRTG